MLVPVFDIRRDHRIGSHVFHFAFLGFARFFTRTGQSGGFSFSSLASLWPKFASPRFRMFEDFAFRLDCLPDIRGSNNVFLRTQIFFWFCSLRAFTATGEVQCCEN
jgi:hypothetical protein